MTPDTTTPADGEGSTGTGTRGSNRVLAPEYEQGRMLREELSSARRDVLRRKFGPVRTHFKRRAVDRWRLQRKLNQARMGTTYDIYLTRSVLLSVLAGLAGAALGVAVTLALSSAGIVAGLTAPVPVRGGWVSFISANRVVFVGAVVTLVSMGTLAAVTWIARYYYPFILVDSRRRNVDVMLPHAIVYMYALSFGGMGFLEVLRRMGAADDTYGEVAAEFEVVVRDVETFGNDLQSALRNARNLTPSDRFEQFLDDLLSVLDSGGDVTEFLRDESEKYMEEAKAEQDSFLETLGTLSEVFIVMFVAAPLFFIVTFVLTTLLGSAGFTALYAIIYGVLPLGIVGFLVLTAVLSDPYREPHHQLPDTDRDLAMPRAVADDDRYAALTRIRWRRRLRAVLSNPVARLRRQPLYSLGLTLPVAAGVVLAGMANGLDLTPSGFLEAPFRTTAWVVVAPFFVVAVPLAAFHELREHRKRHVAARLPNVLDLLGSANQMGVPFVEALAIVTRNTTGRFATELEYTRNDIRWNHDIRGALLSLAERVAVPQLTRTCRILAEGSRTTDKLHRVIDIAAEDTRHRHRLDTLRQQRLNVYVAVVTIGFLIYLGVVVVIDYSFITPVARELGGTSTQGGALPVTLGAGSVARYRAVFFHSALIQAVGTGLIIGQLSDNHSLSGLKYSIGLVAITLAVFVFL